MSQKGKCTNHAGCVLAYRGEEITVSAGPFVCPECGSPLQTATVSSAGSGKNLLLSGAAGLVLLVALSVIVLFRPKQEPAPQKEATPTPVPAAEAAPVAQSVAGSVAAPAPTEPPVARAVPVGNLPETKVPAAVAVTGEPPAGETLHPQPVAAAKPDLDLSRAENRSVKSEVLKRIDLMPTISADNKDRLYVSVERARQMGRLITIPFASGRSSISASDIENLKGQLALPQVKSLLQDPTAVFVILGFADTKGNEQKNQAISEERAKHVLGVLRDRCNVLNVMHSVGMGGSTLFDPNGTEKNRVAEIWVVLP